jgi:hypothetical protein
MNPELSESKEKSQLKISLVKILWRSWLKATSSGQGFLTQPDSLLGGRMRQVKMREQHS